jgi:hypothetical protein
MAAIEEVVDWATATNENLAHHPTGPQGRDARRTSISFQEMQAAIARWRDSLGGGSPLTTKGDIYTYSTIDDRLPVGTNGQLLSANAGEATGLLWVDPPAGTIGGSITDNQIAVGAATADEIEGTATLTYDATYLKMDDVAPFGLMLTNTSSGANAKKFSFDNYFGIAGIRFWNDAESSATELVTYQRSGTTATTISHQGNRFVFFPDSTDQGFDIHHNILELGNPLSGSAARISTPLTSDTLRLQAGTLNFGSHIELNGSSATNANDFRIGHGASLEIIAYDYSAGQLTLKSGGASPAVAVTIDNSQHVTFAEKVIFDASTTADPSFNVPEGVAPTTPVDGDVWVTAAGEFFAHLNGVSVDLAGGGGVGISGTPVNNQLAVWTDATTIEGEPSLTFNNANDRLTIGAGAAGAANPQLTIDAQLAGVPEIAFLQAGATKAFISYVDVDDMFAIGADNEIEFRPFNSGDWGILSTTSAKFGNYTFNTDQTVGVGQDNFVLTYDNASGEISLEAAPATTPGGSNLQLQYNDNGSFNGSSFCYFDLSGTSGQNPTLFLDASDPTTFWRNPRLRLVHDQHDVSHIEFYEELVRKADIRYESLSAGALDSLHIQNFTNAQSNSTTTGAIYLTVRTSGGSNQSKMRANQYGCEFLNGNIRLYARSSASYPDSTTTGQIYINNGDNLLYFRDGSGTEYDLTGATAPTATTVQGNDPYIGWIEDDAALDQGYWRLIADGEALIGRIYDDIETNSYDWLTVNRSGTGTGVQVDTLDFTAATDITFNALTKVEGINPEFELSETGVATDQGIWLFEAETETLYGRLRDDAASNLTDWLTVTRSGTGASMVTDKITLTATDISLDGNPSIGDGSELTIATGSITPTTGFHTVDTEADAATDDLTTIAGGTTGQILVLKSVVDTRNVVVKDGTNIALSASTDFTLENADDSITLLYTGTKWIELSRSTNV